MWPPARLRSRLCCCAVVVLSCASWRISPGLGASPLRRCVVREAKVDVDSEWAAYKRSRGVNASAAVLGEDDDSVEAEAEAEEEEETFPFEAKPPRIKGAPRLGRERWASPGKSSDDGAASAGAREPFSRRREVRGGRDVPETSGTRVGTEFRFLDRASDPRTFAAGGAVLALSFVFYLYVFLTGGIDGGDLRYLDESISGDDGVALPATKYDQSPGETVWI